MEQSPAKDWKLWCCFLMLASITVAGAYVGNSTKSLEESTPGLGELSHVVGPQKIPTGWLGTRRGGGMYQKLLGTSTTDIPDTLTVDFGAQLAKMRESKVANFGATPVALQTSKRLEKQYREGRHLFTLRGYIETADLSTKRMNQMMDWEGFCAARNMSSRQCDLLVDIAGFIDGRMLLAIGLTELMPAAEGRFNVAILDLLLRHAGREYIEMIPSQHDSVTSVGQYQWTQYAVYHADDGIRGASLLARHLSDPTVVPGSVSKLVGDDHHEAAYLFAMRNVARIIFRLGDDFSYFATNWREHELGFVEMIAMSHHAPNSAVPVVKRWVDAQMNGHFGDYTAGKRAKPLSWYAEKTRANYQALCNLSAE